MKFINAILDLVPDAKCATSGNEITAWYDSRSQPTEEQIKTKIAELETAEPLRLLRQHRNQLLQQSDWRMLADYPGTNQTEWQTYRQSLRDLTTQSPSLDSNGNLTGITWPTPPTD